MPDRIINQKTTHKRADRAKPVTVQTKQDEKKKKKNTGVKRNHSRTHSKKGTNDDISHNIPTASLDSINQSINQY